MTYRKSRKIFKKKNFFHHLSRQNLYKKLLKKGGDSQLSELINQYEKQFSPKINHQKDKHKKSQKNNNKDKNISQENTKMSEPDYKHLESSLSQDQLSKTDTGDT